ncbi:MAG: polysaccharide biosynthesis tyrosine autokinase [Verrucomicrobiales bacterium]
MSSRNRRQASDFDDFDDDDFSDAADDGQLRKERMRRMLLDLAGRWYWVVLGLILGVLAASYYLSKKPKEYTATSTILIKERVASVMSRDQVEEMDMRSAEAMNTFAQRILRFELLERVASRPDVRSLPGLVPAEIDWRPAWLIEKSGGVTPTATKTSTAPPQPQVLAGMIGSWMDVSVRKFTRLLDVSVTHPSPEVCKVLADAVCLEYLAEMSEGRTEGRSESISLLERKAEEARNGLQAARSALSIYARTLQVHQALDEKEAEVEKLRARYLPKHPKMVSATADLERLEDRFLREFEVSRKAVGDQAYWESVASQLPERDEQADDYLRVARQLLLARIGVLDSEIQSSTTVFNSMLTRIDEAGVNMGARESSAEIHSLARVPGGPSAPLPNKIYGMGGGLGCMAGLMIAFLLTRIDNKFHTVAQVTDETSMTVLAAIADIQPSHLAAARKAYRKNHPDSEFPEWQEDWAPSLIFREGSASTSYAEMFRVLRASVTLLGDETRRKITLFTSALPGEGKTSTSANFALAAAGQGKKTLLMDFDFRKPSVHKLFGLERDQETGGLTECLAGIKSFDEVILKDLGEDNLHLALSGKRAPNPGELLNASRLKDLLEEACERYDVVVLDTAPVLAVPDTRILAPLADNVCLVVRADYAPKGAVRRTLEVMQDDGNPPSGLVFNGFKEKRRLIGQNYSYGYYRTSKYGRAYRYGYGSYGSYGEEDDQPRNRKKRNKRRKSKKTQSAA